MEFNNNSFADIIMPQGSNADRIILFGVDQTKLKNEYDYGKLGSFITTVLNNKKIKNAKLVSTDLGKKGENEANIIYGMALNTYRFNKYFTDEIKKEITISALLI